VLIKTGFVFAGARVRTGIIKDLVGAVVAKTSLISTGLSLKAGLSKKPDICPRPYFPHGYGVLKEGDNL